MFTAWHYLARIGFFGLFALAAGGLLAPAGSPWHQMSGWGAAGMVILGITGGILAIRLLFTKFTFSCPHCGTKDTEFGMNKRDGMWLACDECGITREAGFLKLSLVHEPHGDEPDADDEESETSRP